jgi:hypothetical protein
MYVCMYVCIYVYLIVCSCTCMYVDTNVHMYYYVKNKPISVSVRGSP